MKKNLLIVLFLLLGAGWVSAQNTLSPFFKGDPLDEMPDQLGERISQQLESGGFKVLGTYHPEGKLSMLVIAFTRDDLKSAVFSVADRGALASVLRAAVLRENGKSVISLVNPEYMFHAYLRDKASSLSVLSRVSADARAAVGAVAGTLKPFGGSLEVSKLHKYHYMMGMPYFTDPVKLKTFSSFSEGVAVIRKNLAAKKNSTLKVYEIVDPGTKTAVFGVGLLNPEKGEGHFLPIIGEDHLAAMPYEIILQGTEATMLHGRFRFALYWPELTMKTFTKIMSSPGDVEDFLKSVTE